MTACVLLSMQSLADIARKEAERRQWLEQQGIEGKTFERYDVPSASKKNQAKAPPPSEKPKKPSTGSVSPESRVPVGKYRTALQKLDREIRQDEQHLTLLKSRLEKSRWALPKIGRLTTQNRSDDTEARLQKEIEELQIKLKELRLERSETYEEGKKAGFLPGELEGRN
jgi:predicted RNase H-like nuclease (RuvC/YqgF family)